MDLINRVIDLTAAVAQRFLGPNPEDYAEGYEDCRREILAYLNLVVRYEDQRRHDEAASSARIFASVVENERWRLHIHIYRGLLDGRKV